MVQVIGNGVAAGLAMVAFANYDYNIDLAGGANYTPPVKTMFCFGFENKEKGDVEYYDVTNTAWVVIVNMTDFADYCYPSQLIQCDAQKYRIVNTDAGALDFSCWGITWS